MIEKVEELEEIDENSHIIHLWEPFDFQINENYKFVNKDTGYRLCSDMLYYGIVAPIIFLIGKMILGIQIKGRENFEKVDTGAISVSNHIHVLDCAFIGLATFPKRIYYTATSGGFKMPIVRHIIKFLNVLPIPEEIGNKRRFVKAVDELLEANEIVHVYPEAALWPYHKKIRKFKNGAFEIAVKNDVPIIPMVYTYRNVTGFRRYIKKKPFLTLNVLEPIYPNNNLARKEAIDDLKNRVHKVMEKECSC